MRTLLTAEPTVKGFHPYARKARNARNASACIARFYTSVSTGPGLGPGPLQSNIASVRCREHFLDQTLSLCSSCSLVFVYRIKHTLHQPQKRKQLTSLASGEYLTLNFKFVYVTFSASKN